MGLLEQSDLRIWTGTVLLGLVLVEQVGDLRLAELLDHLGLLMDQDLTFPGIRMVHEQKAVGRC